MQRQPDKNDIVDDCYDVAELEIRRYGIGALGDCRHLQSVGMCFCLDACTIYICSVQLHSPRLLALTCIRNADHTRN